MAAVAVEPPPVDWAALQQQLNKKQSFEAAAATAAAAVATADQQLEAARAVVLRCRTLLKARFTAPPFWLAGRKLFEAARAAAAASGDDAFASQMQDAIAECNEVLGEEQEAPSGSGSAPAAAEGAPAAARGGGGGRGFLFEGQLSSAEPAPQQPNLYDLLGAALGQQLAAAQAQQAQQEGEQQGEQPAPAGPSPDVLEAIERELDAIAVQIMEETGQAAAAQRSAPPASKKVVASLPKERLTEERLAELGDAGVRCPVCMEELAVGDEVQVMPCSGKHVFHPPCLAPWLADNNSCPTCRHELPTDDMQYERRKEQEREEEEERRGAANAISHNEFLYI